jgi:DNA topoisomerase I
MMSSTAAAAVKLTDNNYDSSSATDVVAAALGGSHNLRNEGAAAVTATMQHHLVIVESPAKCKTIESILNSSSNSEDVGAATDGGGRRIQYTVTSCMGHIRNLPKKNTVATKPTTTTTKARGARKKDQGDDSNANTVPGTDHGTRATATATTATTAFPYAIAGIDLHNKYKPTYVVIEGKEKTVRELQRAVQTADAVLLATDPDREGEAMAWHLADVLNLVPATATATTTTISPSSAAANNNHQTQSAATKTGKSSRRINSTKPYRRIRFTEITPRAILEAVSAATTTTESRGEASIGSRNSAVVDENLVAAQETRRILDRLAGFTVSPMLWRKIAPGLSAGRVQSVGLHLIVQRERKRLQFVPVAYCDVTALLPFPAKLHAINGTAIATGGKDFGSGGNLTATRKIHLRTVEEAQVWIDTVHPDNNTVWAVKSISSRPLTLHPPRPYKTSTLQQDAVRKLGMSVQSAMRTAQTLYEGGFISYMRTDSTTLSNDAERAVERAVSKQFGSHMVSAAASSKSSSLSKKGRKDKFAQEAHEAIRPAIQSDGIFLMPDYVPLSGPEVALYRMIFQRTLAHRMPPLITNQTMVVIKGVKDDTVLEFRTSGSVVVSPGYTLAYQTAKGQESEGDDADSASSDQNLPPLQEGQLLTVKEIFPVKHETQPPPRYTEASFVKELEALGVGRPSTYAGIVQILRDRAYVGSPVGANDRAPRKRNGKAPSGPAISAIRAAGGEEFIGGSARGPLVPSLSAFVVCALLEKHCPTYVDPSFTARMEDRLDQIANAEISGEDERVAYLDEFYAGENGLAAQIKRIDESVDASEARKAVLPALEDQSDDEVGIFIGPWGPYIQKVNGVSDDSSGKKASSAALPPGLAADISTIKPSTLKTLLLTKEGGGTIIGQGRAQYSPENRKIWSVSPMGGRRKGRDNYALFAPAKGKFTWNCVF